MARRRATVSRTLLNDASTWSEYPRIARWSASRLLIWDFCWLVLLGFLLLGWFKHWAGVDRLPASIGGVLPLVVPWAGALGGVAISMVGVVGHYADWGPNVDENKEAREHPGFAQRLTWNAWHVARPFVGAVFGSVAALLLVFILKTLGVDSAGKPDTSVGATVSLLAISFIVGYRDRTFRDLADRVIDTVFGPGSASEESTVYFDLEPSELDFGADVKVNSHKDLTVSIINNSARVMSRDSVTVTPVEFTLVSSNRTLGAYATGDLKVRFSPTVAGAAEGTLAIKFNDVEKTVKLKGTAVT